MIYDSFVLTTNTWSPSLFLTTIVEEFHMVTQWTEAECAEREKIFWKMKYEELARFHVAREAANEEYINRLLEEEVKPLLLRLVGPGLNLGRLEPRPGPFWNEQTKEYSFDRSQPKEASDNQ